MRKTFKKTMCVVLSSAMVLTSGNFSNTKIHIPWDFSFSVEAVDDNNIVDDNKQVTTAIVKDQNLLNELSGIFGQGFTVKTMKNYTGNIVLTNTNISNVEGLGYARKAKLIDISKLTKVKNISEYEFFNCQMTEVKLPTTITSIQKYAFSGCSNLETINLPDSITKIYENAFEKCKKLANVNKTGGLVLPKNLVKLGSFAFTNCEALVSVVIPNTLKTDINSDDQSINTMGTNVFANCVSLSSVTFGSAMTMVPASTFASDTALKSISIPTNFTEIGENAFAITGLTSLNLSNCKSLVTIGDTAFSNCTALASVSLPASLKKINDFTFSNCIKLSKVTIASGSNITMIGQSAFYNNRALTEVSFMNNLTKLKSIGKKAFANSSKDTHVSDRYGDSIYEGGPVSVTIPGTVEEIGEDAFMECRNLEKIEFKSYGSTPTTTIVKRIGNNAFKNDWNLKTVVLPEQNVTDKNMSVVIGEFAFENCQRLSSINFPKCLTTIGRYAFNCAGATKRDNENGGVQVFFGIKNIDLSSNTRLVNIGEYAFQKCINLDSFKFPSNITKIPNGCLSECSVQDFNIRNVFYGLDTVDLGKSVNEIGRYAFFSCRTLTLDENPEDNVNPLPKTLVKIDEGAFEWCSDLGPIVFPENVETIEGKAFDSCGSYNTDSKGYDRVIDLSAAKSIPTIDFSKAKKISFIGNDAFAYTAVKDVIFDSTTPLKSIRQGTFYGCTKLGTVYLGDNVENIMECAFGACSNLDNVSIPEKTIIETGTIMKRGENHPATYPFSLKLRTPSENITVRENDKDEIGLYPVLARYDVSGYSAKFSTVKVSNVTYTWDDTTKKLTTTGNAASLPLTPSVETVQKVTTGSNSAYNINALYLSGKKETKNVSVVVGISIALPLWNDGSMRSFSTSAEYKVNVSKVPCTSIKCDDLYLNSGADQEYQGKVVAPKFNPETTTDEIKWTKESNDKLIMKVSDDKRSAKFYLNSEYAINERYGSTKVTVKAGSVEESFTVYVCAPANGMSLDKRAVNIPYNSTEKITATIRYDERYASIYSKNPDGVKFISSDESIFKVVNVTSKIGSSVYEGNTFTCEMAAVNTGKAKLKVLAEGGNIELNIDVAVVTTDIKMSITDLTTGSEMVTGNSTQLYAVDNEVHPTAKNTRSKVYSYSFSKDTLSSNDFDYIIDDESIVRLEDYNTVEKTFKLVGMSAGKTELTIWPKGLDASANGVTVTVYVTSDIGSISLYSKTIKSGEPESIIHEIWNYYGNVITDKTKDFSKVTNNELIFTSSNKSIATVNNKGVVTVKNPGAVTISCEAVAPDGTVVRKGSCTVNCKVGIKNLTINKIPNQEYTGDYITPKVTVKRGGKTLKEGIDYSIGMRDNGGVGTATVVVECRGDYEGVAETKFDIVPRKVPNLKQLNSKGKKASITWTKLDEADKYEVSQVVKGSYKRLGLTNQNKFTCNLGKNSSMVLAVRSLKVVNGKKYYGNYLKVTVVKAPGKVKLKSLKAGKKKITVKWKATKGAKGYAIYMSTNKKKGYKVVAYVKGAKKTKYIKKKLQSKQKYFFKVRAYKLSGKTKVLGAFSKVKSKKCK